MHIISDKSLGRRGYTYNSQGVGYLASIEPQIQWDHIDGPLLYTSDCGLHWLTLWERIQMHFGWTDIWALDNKHRRDC